jgi:hypothetical protein
MVKQWQGLKCLPIQPLKSWKLNGRDAIIYAQEDNFVSCYFGRKKFGIVWQGFAGIGVFREVDDISENAIKQYKQDCISMYEVNDMGKW